MTSYGTVEWVAAALVLIVCVTRITLPAPRLTDYANVAVAALVLYLLVRIAFGVFQ